MWFILSLASISSLKLQNKYFQFVFILNWNSSILKCLLKFNFAKCHPIQEIIKSFSIYEPWTWVGIKNKICLEFKIHRSLNHRIIHYLKVQLLSSIDLLLSLEFLVQKWSFTLTREMSRQPSQWEAKPHFKLKKKVKTNILLTCKLKKNNLSIFFILSFQIPRQITN